MDFVYRLEFQKKFSFLVFRIPNDRQNPVILILGVCIILRVLDQVQWFPSNATLFQ
jgi:hypothetical protein